jgi:NitT/TauT family transport system permease protein
MTDVMHTHNTETGAHVTESVVDPSEAFLEPAGASDVQPEQGDKKRFSVSSILGPLAVLGVFIGLWYLAAYKLIPHNFTERGVVILVPPPHRLFENMGGEWTKMFQALWLSTKTALLGLVLAIVIGMVLAIVMSQAKWVEKAIYPYLVALQAIPILALVPLIANTIGTNFRSRVVVCVLIAMFPIVSNTLFGILSVDRNQHDIFSLHRTNRVTRMFKLQLPAAMPAVFTGFRISAGLSVIGAIVGDFFFQQGEPGLGYRIVKYFRELQPGRMFVAAILASLLGIVVFVVFGLLSKRVVGHWHETNRTSHS